MGSLNKDEELILDDGWSKDAILYVSGARHVLPDGLTPAYVAVVLENYFFQTFLDLVDLMAKRLDFDFCGFWVCRAELG